MPEFILDKGSPDAARQFGRLRPFDQGYIEAMFFTSTGSADDEELETATVADLAPETWEEIVRDCAAFTASIRKTWQHSQRCGATATEDQAGRDFWFTRNRHGVGFWDRDAEVYAGQGNFFSDKAREFGEVNLYRGDDGQLYLGG